jgi:hypothetical protein
VHAMQPAGLHAEAEPPAEAEAEAEPQAEAEAFASVATLLAAVGGAEDLSGRRLPQRVRLERVNVLERRKVSRDKLCFYVVSDRFSSGARLGLRMSASRGEHGPGELDASTAAAAIRGSLVGTVIDAIEGVLRFDPADGTFVLSCDCVEPYSSHDPAADSSEGGAEKGLRLGRNPTPPERDWEQPTLLFDLNYAEEMTADEFTGLCRQLRLSYSANRRSAHAFRISMAGTGMSPPVSAADGTTSGGGPLWQAAVQEHWDRWSVRLHDDSAPWTLPEYTPSVSTTAGQHPRRLIYLAAESPNLLDRIEPACIYVIGGLVDHKAK